MISSDEESLSYSSTNLHSIEECDQYTLSQPPTFSHRRYFGIQLRKLLYSKRTNRPFLSSHVFANLTDLKVLSKQDLENNFGRLRPEIRSLFISSDFIESLDWIQDFLPNLEVLVSGHSDRNFEKSVTIPNSVKVWFSQNNAIVGDSRIRLLPIGIENLSLGRSGQKKYFRESPVERVENRVLVPPFSPTNRIRKKVVLECRKKPDIFEVVTQMTYEKEYFDLLSRYRYVLCLEGNGFDTHRLWETLYLGGFPVVLESPWSVNLKQLNLPILIVNSVHEINLSLLVEFQDSNSNFDPRDREILWSSYWNQAFKQLP